MIIGKLGFNGSGKTLSMAKDCTGYDTVFCNFGYKGVAGQKVCQMVEVPPLIDVLRQYVDLLMRYRKKQGLSGCGERIVLAIDEAGLNFPARAWKNVTKKEAYLFAQHRKLGIDFCYTAQNYKMVDSILRNNTAMCSYPRHFFGLFWESWYEGVERDREMFLYRSLWWGSKYYRLYDTLEIVESTKFALVGEDQVETIDNWEGVFHV